jgi:hypothetical protein
MVMARSSMARAVLAMLLAATATEVLAQCPEEYKTSNDRKLEYLNKEFDRNNRDSVHCAFSLMDQLSRKGEKRVIPVLIRNLDLELPFDRPMFKWVGKYPAIGDLTLFDAMAVPALLDTIAQSAAGSVLNQNATIVLMVIQRADPPAGIKMLLNRAAKEQAEAADNMMTAARFAISFCGSKRQACEDELNSVQ